VAEGGEADGDGCGLKQHFHHGGAEKIKELRGSPAYCVLASIQEENAASAGGEMNSEAAKEIFNELFSHLERLETQSEAILQFLKEKKRVTDKQLAPYLEQAGNASNVKWRAARVRIEHLLAPEQPEEEIKLGKKPELQEDSARSGSSEDKRTESDEKDESTAADGMQARPADGKLDKSEQKSESAQENKEQTAEGKPDAGDLQHPTEVGSKSAEQEGAEPAAQLESKEKKAEEEAA
jgi:hypothetical protein